MSIQDIATLSVISTPDRTAPEDWLATLKNEYFMHAASLILAGLLKSIEPIFNGEPVIVDGIAKRSNPYFGIKDKRYETARTFVGTEPAVVMLGSIISRILEQATFTFAGKPVEVDGFRIRHPNRWANYPSTTLETIGPISSYCNVRCRFCYEQGNELPFNARFLSHREAQDRLEHYDVNRGRGLPLGNTYSLEPLCNPDVLSILSSVRQKNQSELFKLTTHGSNLTDNMIRGLARLKPIILVVSLNTVSPDGRRSLMADHHPEVALSALPKLRNAGIPFIGSIVPWPTLTLDEVEATLRYFDYHGARMIRVSLPSFTRHFRREDMFDTQEVWGRIIERVLAVRPQLSTPINMMPTSYWNIDNRAVVEGTYPGSPASFAGLRVGDVILSVGKERVFLRHQAKRLLEREASVGNSVMITIERDGRRFETKLQQNADRKADLYPYKPSGYAVPNDAFGIFFTDGFKLSYVQRIVDHLDQRRPKRAILFASQLIRPLFQATAEAIEGYQLAATAANLELIEAPCEYWGGNVMLGDLNVVQDFEPLLERLAASRSRPDLVMLPGTFLNHRGFDLRGAHYKELSKYRIPIEILRCDVMMK